MKGVRDIIIYNIIISKSIREINCDDNWSLRKLLEWSQEHTFVFACSLCACVYAPSTARERDDTGPRGRSQLSVPSLRSPRSLHCERAWRYWPVRSLSALRAELAITPFFSDSRCVKYFRKIFQLFFVKMCRIKIWEWPKYLNILHRLWRWLCRKLWRQWEWFWFYQL